MLLWRYTLLADRDFPGSQIWWINMPRSSCHSRLQKWMLMMATNAQDPDPFENKLRERISVPLRFSVSMEFWHSGFFHFRGGTGLMGSTANLSKVPAGRDFSNIWKWSTVKLLDCSFFTNGGPNKQLRMQETPEGWAGGMWGGHGWMGGQSSKSMEPSQGSTQAQLIHLGGHCPRHHKNDKTCCKILS